MLTPLYTQQVVVKHLLLRFSLLSQFHRSLVFHYLICRLEALPVRQVKVHDYESILDVAADLRPIIHEHLHCLRPATCHVRRETELHLQDPLLESRVDRVTVANQDHLLACVIAAGG